MYKNNLVGAVIPAYNEEGFIGDVIRDVPEYVDSIFVIDDCSTDGTWDEIHSAAKEDSIQRNGDGCEDREKNILGDGGHSLLNSRAKISSKIGRVVPIQHRENLGAGGAIKTGYLAALAGDVEIVTTIDGDGQMDTSLLPRFLDPIAEGKADYTKGNRLLSKEYRKDMPKFRFFGNAILTFLTKISSGYWKMMDPQNGYTAISSRALSNIEIENMYGYYGYCNDILVKLNAKGFKIADVDMPAVYGDEESSINYPTYIRKVSLMLLRNFIWRLNVKYLVLDFHPLALFYYFGAVTCSLGILGGLFTIYTLLTTNIAIFTRGTVSLILFMMGSMFIMFAMLFDMEVNQELEVRHYQ